MPSVLTLHLRAENGLHIRARVFEGRQLVGHPTLHPQMKDAIAAYGQGISGVPEAVAFDIWYEGWSVGQVSRERMQENAAELAQRLIMLSAVMR